MNIITEQNILGNPELAEATRPGKGTIAAKFAFSNGGYEMNKYKVAAQVNSSWTAPQSYSPSVDVAEVVENETKFVEMTSESTFSVRDDNIPSQS